MEKKLIITFICALFLLAGCAGVISGGNRELTLEEVQQFAQQTMTARVSEGQDNGQSANSGQLLIRPVQQATPENNSSGVNVISRPDDNVGITTRPTSIPTAIPTAAAAPQYPVYQIPTAVPTAVPNYAQQVNTVCERVRFIDDVTIPDDTVMKPGQTFRKVWRIQNGGSCACNSGYQLIYTGGDSMGTNYGVNLSGPVNPGDTVDVSIDLTAPYAYGTYQSNWKLRSPSGNVFGTSNSENDAIWVKIVVGTNANMATVAPGVTPVNTGCTLLSVVPAHRASFSPGEETDFSFRVRNNTYNAWKADDLDIAYISGENMLKRKDQPRKDLPYDVNPGGILDYALDAVVPNTPGIYTMTMGIVRGYEILCTMDVTLQVVY